MCTDQKTDWGLSLAKKIADRSAGIAVIGLGYVGLPLALAFCRAGFSVVGIDVDPSRVDMLQRGESYLPDVVAKDIKRATQSQHLAVTTDYAAVQDCNVVIICVPTPLRKTKEPDLSYVVQALDGLVLCLHKGMLIILESSTYPGTTEELLVPRIEAGGYGIGEDIFLCYSPERVDPGNKRFGIENTPKIVGGVTQECASVGRLVYQAVSGEPVVVSTARTAEMVKLLESTFRAVNIALANEMMLLCERLGVDVWEVIDAAATKPFGFMPFYPGPGIGGHCIPLDPVYLAWKARSLDFHHRFIQLATEINSNMPEHTVRKVIDALNRKGKALKGSRVLVVGIAYKQDVNDVRESPSLSVIRLLEQQGALVAVYDPYVPQVEVDGRVFRSVTLTSGSLRSNDCVVLMVGHSRLPLDRIVADAKLIVDTRNVLGRCSLQHVVTMGRPETSAEGESFCDVVL